MANHPITPPPELVTSLRNSAPGGIRDAGVTRELHLIAAAYAAGADQELEACVECLVQDGYIVIPCRLRAARRSKPPSLKEQALADLDSLVSDLNNLGMGFKVTNIRRALEQLND